jgi:ribosomal protein S18 acetylase RimI-like enzyme
VETVAVLKFGVSAREQVRVATEADIEEAALVVYSSFRAAADTANAYSDTARSPERSKEIVREAVLSDGIYAMVATVASGAADGGVSDGAEYIVGFNCLLEANLPLFGMGPLGVRTGWQGSSIGSQLLRAALVRAGTSCADANSAAGALDEGKQTQHLPTVRLTVDAYNSPALALYIKAGFVVTEPVTVFEHLPLEVGAAGHPDDAAGSAGDIDSLPVVEATWNFCKMQLEDMPAVSRLSSLYGGCDRSGEVEAALVGNGRAYVVREVASGEVCAYTTGISFDGHTIASSVPAAIALLNGMRRVDAQAHLRMMVPLRTAPQVGEHCLRNGWRVVKQLLLMSHGELRMPQHLDVGVPAGVFIPTADG